MRAVIDQGLPIGRNHTLLAAFFICIYASAIGFTDNFVQVIARDTGLWQFHATRTAMACVIVGLVSVPMGLRLQPRNWAGVTGRSLLHGFAMMIYFGCLGFLSVAEVAAGLFTAPIFVLLISRFVYGHSIGPFRILALAMGFSGALLVLGVAGDGRVVSSLGLASLLPILAGAFYAMGNIATREWCEGESPETLLLGFFAALGILGLAGMAVLSIWHPVVPPGADGFVLRGPVWPSQTFLFWTFVQAVGSLFGVGMMVRAYQIAEASRVAIFEYVVLPMSALWAWVLWGDVLTASAAIGIVLIIAAGVIIALRGK